MKKSSGTKPKTFGINFENTSVQSVRDIVNYKKHPSITKMKQLVKTVNETEIKNLRNLDIKKASSTETIPPKLRLVSVLNTFSRFMKGLSKTK